VLLELLGSGSALLAPAAASGLGIACRAGDDSALRQLVNATTSADRALQSASIAALGEIGSAKSVAALEALVQSGENFSSAQAAISLALIHHPEALSQIEHVLRKKNPDRESAWHYLTAAGVLGDHRLVEHILPWVRQSKDPALRQKAAIACAMLHGESLVQDLLESLADSVANQSALFATLGALATTGDGRSIPALTRLVDRSAGLPELSRAAVISSLGMLADKDSEPMLQRWRHGVQTAAAGAVVRSLLRVN
jgi:HEAT repeat protein